MRAARRSRPPGLPCLLCLLCLLCLWGPALGPESAGAAEPQDLVVSGRAAGPEGRPVAGLIVSDEHAVAKSGEDGYFSLATRAGRVVSVAAPPGWRPAGRWWWPAERAAAGRLEPALERAPATSSPVIALAADPHLWDRETASPERPPPQQLLDAPLAGWGRLAAGLAAHAPELTVVAGDLCHDADRASPRRARALLRLAARAMGRLPAPARALPGNHDARYSGGEADLSLWREHLGPARQVFLLAGAAAVLVDTPAAGSSTRGRPRSSARLSPQALAWLAAVLEAAPEGARLVVVSHHPLATPLAGSNPVRRRGLVRSLEGKGLALRDAAQGAAEALKLLHGRPVAALASGHEHAAWRAELTPRGEAWRLFGLPAVCGGWWRGDRRLGPLAFPAGYLLLRLGPGGRGPSARLVELDGGR